MKKILLALATLGVLASAGSASTAWSPVGTNVVASSPVAGGGYPVPPGSTKPLPGTCGPQMLNSNHSESWLAVKPGTEDIVGDSKFFIGKWSTFYDFHLGSYTILNGSPVSNNQVQGYECTTVGTQNMPPSWTMNTDPNVDWDTQGRAYHDDPALQRVLGGWPAPERRDRRVVLGRHGRALGEGERRQGSGFDEQPDEPHAGPRRGQGMDRRQPHRREREPGPRLRDVDDLQRRVRWQQDHGCRLARPGTDVLEGRPADDAFGDDAGEHLRLSVCRFGRHGLRRLRQRVRHDEQEPGRPCLRDEVSRRRQYVDPVHASRRPRSRTRTATSRRRTSGTGSSRTSPPARPIRGTST